VLTGDLTNSGDPLEMHALLEALVHVRVPIVTVLGNHDYDAGKAGELMQLLTTVGVKILDGTAYERDGVAFAGTKGFAGGFGRGAFASFGEPEMKAFVRASVDEALKLEAALSQVTHQRTVVVMHYAPVVDTVRGEPPELLPYVGCSRFGEVIDRHGADLVLHSHAHHGVLDGRTLGGAPVHNVSLPLLERMDPPRSFRVFEI
jgi:Icc-related predicted phosphoesterase